MSTKVKGEAIKEGSIPMSALDDISKVILEYNLRGYQGILTGDINTVMVSPYYKNTSIKNIYLYTNNKIFTLPLNGSVTITGGPRIIINCAMDDSTGMYKVTHNDTGNIGYYDKIYVFCGGDKDDIIIETPDWNAQEGEARYIENKPFGKIKVNGELFVVSSDPYICNVHYCIPQEPDIIDLYPSKKVDCIRVYWSESNIVFIDEIINIPDGVTSLKAIKFVNDTPLGSFSLEFDRIESEIRVYLMSQNETFSVMAESALNTISVEAITYLPEEYLSDTVLKTTPQSLSNTDKNQALANLGIDPVVWKYMCDPYVIDASDSGTIPQELVSIIFNNNGYLRPIVQKLIVFVNGPIYTWYENELYDADGGISIAIDTNGNWRPI